jgi:branched-chain amino acid transport system ATP-binding protein
VLIAAHQVVALGICHCPEGRWLFPELTVLKNLMLGAYLRSNRDAIARDLEKVYGLFPVLKGCSGQQASTLSGGEQQMLAVGRALMGKPMLLLLGEPSVGIAHRLKIEIFQAIRAIQQAGTAVLLVEQEFDRPSPSRNVRMCWNMDASCARARPANLPTMTTSGASILACNVAMKFAQA